MSNFVYRFLTRKNCSLCDQARPLVERELGRLGSRFRELDVDEWADLKLQYGERVPVLLGRDEEVLAEGHFNPRALRRHLKQTK